MSEVTQEPVVNTPAAPTLRAARAGLLQRKCACGAASGGLSGDCDECQKKQLTVQRYSIDRAAPFNLVGSLADGSDSLQSPGFGRDLVGGPTHKFGRARVHARAPRKIQTKLAISNPGDEYEREADRIAEEITGRSLGEYSPLSKSLSTAEPSIQRAPADLTGSSGTASPEQAPASTTPETTPTREATAAGLIVEDDSGEVGHGQMRKSEFLDQLQAAVCSAADAELLAVGRTAQGCPYIEKWIGHYRTKSSDHVERALRRYAPEAGGITSARDYIPLVAARVRRSVSVWATTGLITDVPAELADQLPGGGVLGAVGGFLSGVAGVLSSAIRGVGRVLSGVFTKARLGGARDAGGPQQIQAQLRSGSSLDIGVKSKMESAFGHDFSRVHVHTDSRAAELSNSLNARAFTIGSDIAFAAGEYRPGTMVGDALLAHELAHVVQQGRAGSSAGPMHKGGSNYEALEEDADESAVGAVVAHMSETKGRLFRISRTALPRLKSGLQLQGCGRERERKLSIKDMGQKWREQFIKKNFSAKDRSVASKTMEDMLESGELTFWDEEALKTEIFKRLKTSQLMQQSQSLYGVAFEYPNHPSAKKCLPNNEKGDKINPRVNKAAEKYWGPVQDPQGTYHWDLSDEGKKNGFEALKTLFIPQKSICDMTLIHCDYLASVVHFRAFAESLGVEEFNQRVRKRDIEMRLAWNGFTELEDKSEKSTSLREVRPASEKDLVIGDHVIFWNHRAYDLINESIHNAWRLENAFLVRKKGKEDRFLGHGSGENSNATMREKLKTEHNDVVKMAEPIILRTKSKDSKTASAAVTEMEVRFPKVKEEGGVWKIKGRKHGKTFDEKLERIEANNPDLTGLRDPEDPSKMNCVKRPAEAPGESC